MFRLHSSIVARSNRYISNVFLSTLNVVNNNNNSATARPIHISSQLDAGHSKWANIRHIKALKDGQRSVQFVKLARQIRLAIQGSFSRLMGGDMRLHKIPYLSFLV